MSKIAIVDDSSATIEAIERILRNANHRVVSFQDATGVEEELEKIQPQVILLDIVMPGTNGYQILRKLRKKASTAEIPVVLVSSKGEPADIKWGLQQGAAGYLAKPFSEADLIDAISRALNP